MSPDPYPGGKLKGFAGEGLQAHTQGEVEGSGPACTEAATPPPQQMATAADGTHPTGMHSCLIFIYDT